MNIINFINDNTIKDTLSKFLFQKCGFKNVYEDVVISVGQYPPKSVKVEATVLYSGQRTK